MNASAQLGREGMERRRRGGMRLLGQGIAQPELVRRCGVSPPDGDAFSTLKCLCSSSLPAFRQCG